MKKIIILTIFPQFYNEFLQHSIISRAIKNKFVEIKIINIREFSKLNNNQVDDTSYGGGNGMVMMCEPIVNAIESVDPNHEYLRIYMSPQGRKLENKKVIELSKNNKILILCGHYEGVDERVLNFIDEEISIGDFVVTGGEVASLPLIDSIIRFIPGVIQENSVMQDSFNNNMLDYPHYTKPQIFRNLEVPSILLSGNHKNIQSWREDQAKINTEKKRPDLLKKIKKE